MMRIAVIADPLEEGWPSMDLAAEQLARGLLGRADVRFLRPRLRALASRLPLRGRAAAVAWNADRLAHRTCSYPRWLRRHAPACEAYHVCDHSYAQLVHALPAERTGVYLHDLDAFRCLLEPARDPRPAWFRSVARRALRGLERAAVVFHSTLAVRAEALRHGVVDPARLVHAPLGVAPGLGPDGPAGDGQPGDYLLHVGSALPRKRLDVLVGAFTSAARARPDLRLVQVGGTWPSALRRRLDEAGLSGRVEQVRGVPVARLAALYRGARLVLVPSDAEGFGLPALEALACGAPLLASDLPALREVAGAAASYAPAGDLAAWVDALGRLLDDPGLLPPRRARLDRAAHFSWARHADAILGAYARLGRG